MRERCNQWKNPEFREKRTEKSVQIEKCSAEELKKSLIVAQTGKDKSFQREPDAKDAHYFWNDEFPQD